ncbi:Hypothetical_protein [Hexamita inflata]|uniref:Hypothetical_protein n=1 Tax=Hexamita inflata TaxID=28002 RepID=A0AA86PEA4_9EUKA|nr:Hypothetical protein HINF_LOCUS25174 [Hexamita inflata]CAI9949162.1 Hypothetical protein HINF_LOCUS36807 [Hexamita inflata]
MTNGDLYVIGSNSNGTVSIKDDLCFRKVQENVQNAEIGWKQNQMYPSLYFLSNNDLYVYDSSMNKSNKLISNIFDFSIQETFNSQFGKQQNIAIVSNNSIAVLSFSSYAFNNGTDYFCKNTLFSQKCNLQFQGQDQQCYKLGILDITEAYCNVLNCFVPLLNPDTSEDQNDCSATSCQGDQANNITCWSVVCINAAYNNQFVPQCAYNFVNFTYSIELANAENYIFTNSNFLVNLNNKKDVLNQWGVVGITVGICTFVTIIFNLSMILLCRRAYTKMHIKQEIIQIRGKSKATQNYKNKAKSNMV